MNRQHSSPPASPQITIRVSGKLYHGHLSSLDQLVESATECRLWPMLSLAQLEELDVAALRYLMDGEGRRFGILSCPQFIRDWMERDGEQAAA